jgi:ribonuclease HI
MAFLKSSNRAAGTRPRSFNRTQEFFGAPVHDIDEETIVAHIDGGARGNPGPAGYGVVIEDHAGRSVERLHEFLGTQTNNYAEYSALLAALEYALRQGYKCMKVYTDSELLAKQVRGEYKVRAPGLLDLYDRCKAAIRELSSFEIRNIPREQNREADHLANVAMDEGMFGNAERAAAASSKKNALPREVAGIVRGGVVELQGNSLPDGTRVIVRPAK